MRGAVPWDYDLDLGKLPPQAPELEQAVLGAVMLDAGAMAEVGDMLAPEMFYRQAHRTLFGAIQGLHEEGLPIDILTVTQRLKQQGMLEDVGGAYYLSQLTNKVASSAHVEYHAMIVMQCFVARETIRLNTEAMAATYRGEDITDIIPDTIAQLEARIGAALTRKAERYSTIEAREMVAEVHPKPISTGFRELDTMIGGWMRGDLVIVAARPAMGKSAFAFSSILRTTEHAPSGLVSMELSVRQLLARLFAIRKGVPVSSTLRGENTPHEIQTRHHNLAEIKDMDLWIHGGDSSMTTGALRSTITRMARAGVKVVKIDQLNWITPPKGANRNDEVGAITRFLKTLAKQLDITIVLLHQLSRAVEKRVGDKRPMLSDLRDSGNVEQDAQVVMFLYRPEYYGITEDNLGSTIGMAEVIVAKNSNGSTGSVRLQFDGPTASFKDLNAWSGTETFTSQAPF